MSWLKRHEPIILSQSSDLPFIIKEDGVFLCFYNLYTESDKYMDHYIQFKAYKNDFMKQSTNHFKLKQFPKLIPFDEIIRLDDTIIDGKIIKNPPPTVDDHSVKILVANSSYITNLDDHAFQEFVDNLDNFDKSFILTEDDIEPQIHLLEEDMVIINHHGWYPTAVTIADTVCPLPHRKYCWINSIPTLIMTIYGLSGTGELSQVYESFDNIGVQNKEILWS